MTQEKDQSLGHLNQEMQSMRQTLIAERARVQEVQQTLETELQRAQDMIQILYVEKMRVQELMERVNQPTVEESQSNTSMEQKTEEICCFPDDFDTLADQQCRSGMQATPEYPPLWFVSNYDRKYAFSRFES